MKLFRIVIIFITVNIFVISSFVVADVSDNYELEKVFKDAVQDLYIPGAVMLIRSPEGESIEIVAGVRLYVRFCPA